MNENEEKSKFEELSAWIDNEENSLNDEQKNADEFKETADDFKKIDAAISKVSSAPQAPVEMVDKIAAKCNEKPTISFTRELYKIAAIAAACLLLTFFYSKNDKQEDRNVASTDNTSDKTSEVVMAPVDEENNKVIEALRGNPSTATPSGDFDLIGTNPNNSDKTAVSLGEEVKHVWVSKNPQETVLQIQKLTGLIDTLTTKADAKGNYEFSITLEDTELIKLVNSLSDSGNSLISKEFPQPKQINKISSTGKKVRYNVSILQEK